MIGKRMHDVLDLMEKIGWNHLRPAIRQELIGREGRDQVIRIETVVKIGAPHVLKGEYEAYANFAHYLTEAEMRRLFPVVVLRKVSSTCAILAVEPLPRSTLEQYVLDLVKVAKGHGWSSLEVTAHQKQILHLTDRVLAKLAVLHRPIRGIQRRVEMMAFIRELIRGIIESASRAGIRLDLSSFCKLEELEWKIQTVCLAHRDLGLPNIITDGKDVFFIDPRSHVVSRPGRRLGARFASPAIDLAALLVGFERIELELKRIRPSFQFSAKRRIKQEVNSQLKKGQLSPVIFHLSEAVVWAGYAACRCSQCMEPNCQWLRRHSVARATQCFTRCLQHASPGQARLRRQRVALPGQNL